MDFSQESDHLGSRFVLDMWPEIWSEPRLRDWAGWCQSNKVLYNINCSTRMIIACVEPTKPYGGISVKCLSESKLCVRLDRSGIQSMWLHVRKEKKRDFLCGGWLIGGYHPGWSIKGDHKFLGWRNVFLVSIFVCSYRMLYTSVFNIYIYLHIIYIYYTYI